MEPLTRRQQDVLHYIADVRGSRGGSPTFREIAEAFGVSVGSVQEHLDALKKKGYLEVVPRVRRGIRLTRGRREWRVGRTWRGEFEKRFGERLRRAIDLPGLFTLVREEFPAWLGCGRADLYVRDNERRAWRNEEFHGRHPAKGLTTATEEIRDPLLDAVLRRRRPAAEGAAAVVPVLERDRILGALRLDGTLHQRFSPLRVENHGTGQVPLAAPEAASREIDESVMTRAGMAAAAIAAVLDRASLDADLRRGIQLQAALVGLCRTVNHSGDLHQVLADIYGIVSGLVPAEYFHIGVKDPGAEPSSFAKTSGDKSARSGASEDRQWWILFERDVVDGKPWEYPGFQKAEMHNSEAKRVIQTEPFYLRHRTPEEIRVLEGAGPDHIDKDSGGTSGNVTKRGRSLLYIPLRTGGELVGYFTAQSYSYNAYTIRSAEDLILVGEYIALAVQGAWSRDKERKSLAEARRRLRELGQEPP